MSSQRNNEGFKILLKQTMIAAKNEIAQIYFEAKAKVSSEGEKLEDGWFQKVVDDVKEKRVIGKDIAINFVENNTEPCEICCFASRETKSDGTY